MPLNCHLKMIKIVKERQKDPNPSLAGLLADALRTLVAPGHDGPGSAIRALTLSLAQGVVPTPVGCLSPAALQSPELSARVGTPGS